MKKFKFRLQKVLEYKETLKREQERELAEKNKSLRNEEALLNDLLNAHNSAQSVTEGCEIRMSELRLQGEYSQHLRQELGKQSQRLFEASEAVEQARQEYVAKSVEAKVLDIVKAKRREEHAYEARREERKTLSEINLQRHWRKEMK